MAQTEADLYVSTEGNDSWSGALPEPNADRTDGPLATLEAARDRLRGGERKRRGDLLVLIRGGTYVLEKTFVLGIEDGAPDTSRVVWAAYPGERPVFTSGVAITGWRKLEDAPEALPEAARSRVWVADLPAGVGRFHALYDSEGLLARARTELFMPTKDGSAAGAYDGDLDPLRCMFFPRGKLKAWDNLEDVEVYLRAHNWTMNLLPLESVDEDAQIAFTKLPGTYPFEPRRVWWDQRNPWRPSAAVENVLEALDASGEWVVDTKTRKVHLWPRGERPQGIFAPRLRELIRVEGEVDVDGPVDRPARGLIFRGLTFTCGDRDVWTQDDVGIQHDWEMVDKPDALVRFRGAERCAVEDCTFTQSGGTAVRLDLHCQHCRVTGCEISHMGQGGIMLIGYGPGAKDVNKHNAIINNHIHHCGEIYTHSHGLVLSQSGGNRVAHNYLHDMPRKAICLTGARLSFYRDRTDPRREWGKGIRWREVGEPKTWDDVVQFSHTRGNVVEYNEVARCLQKMGDGAAINVSGAGPGNVLRRNYVHDIFSAEDEWLAGCFRTDDDQAGTLICENVVARSNTSACEHKGENAFVNNIVVGMDPARTIALGAAWGPLLRSRFERNILIGTRADARFYHPLGDLELLGVAEIDHNIYYRVDAAPPAPMGPDLAALRALGHDQNSILADPLLMDWENGDYRLRPDSPAHALGIHSLDVRQAGLLHGEP